MSSQIEQLIEQGRKEIEARRQVLAQVEERRQKRLAKVDEIFKAIFANEPFAGLEYEIEEVCGEYYAVILDHDPAVAIGSNGLFYRLDWVYDDLNDEIIRVAVEQSGSLAEVVTSVADRQPSIKQAKTDQEKARKRAEYDETEQKRGFCPFDQDGGNCVGPRCQLWVAWRGMDACAIKALAFVEMRRDGCVNWEEQ